MKTTKHTTEINGLTFTRFHYEGRPTLSERHRGITTTQLNLESPWTHTVQVEEINSDLRGTGETVGVEIKIWPTQEVIKVDGAERLAGIDAVKLALALTAATQLLKEMVDQARCPNHGTLGENDGYGPDCEHCFNEMEAELDERDRQTRLAANAFTR